jgi:hypothetical protein
MDAPGIPFDASAQEGFRRLAERHQVGEILVTTTHRLLRYLVTRDSLRYSLRQGGEHVTIIIDGLKDAVRGPIQPHQDDLQGISFLARGCRSVELALANRGNLPCVTKVVPDGIVLTVPWRPLEFPTL